MHDFIMEGTQLQIWQTYLQWSCSTIRDTVSIERKGISECRQEERRVTTNIVVVRQYINIIIIILVPGENLSLRNEFKTGVAVYTKHVFASVSLVG